MEREREKKRLAASPSWSRGTGSSSSNTGQGQRRGPVTARTTARTTTRTMARPTARTTTLSFSMQQQGSSRSSNEPTRPGGKSTSANRRHSSYRVPHAEQRPPVERRRSPDPIRSPRIGQIQQRPANAHTTSTASLSRRQSGTHQSSAPPQHSSFHRQKEVASIYQHALPHTRTRRDSAARMYRRTSQPGPRASSDQQSPTHPTGRGKVPATFRTAQSIQHSTGRGSANHELLTKRRGPMQPSLRSSPSQMREANATSPIAPSRLQLQQPQSIRRRNMRSPRSTSTASEADARNASDTSGEEGVDSDDSGDGDGDGDEGGESDDEDEKGGDSIMTGFHHTVGRPIVVKVPGRKRPLLRFHPIKELKVLPAVDVEVCGSMLAFKVLRSNPKVVRAILTQHGFIEVGSSSQDFNIMWASGSIKPHDFKYLTEHQKVNHFPKSYELTRKDRMHVNIQRMQQTKGKRHFDFCPATYLLPGEYDEFYAHWVKRREPWIVKPTASSQGKGIYLISHPQEVPKGETLVLSQYINNPLLVEGFKFDLRIYVAVTSYCPLRIYMYEDGLARFATSRYDCSADALKNSFVHLTNYSVNKASTNYVACTEEDVEDYGNKWSISALMRYLAEAGIDTVTLFARIEEVIIKTIISGELPISAATQSYVPFAHNCFELYGFDILIDSDLKPWLIEVNLSPSLACDAPLDRKIKTHLVADFFNLGQVALMDPPSFREQRRKQRMGLKAKPPKPVYHGAMHVMDVKAIPSLRQYPPEHRSFLRRALEEAETCKTSGFSRIFPSQGTWEYYGFLLEDKNSWNAVLANFLYPARERVSTPPTKSKQRLHGPRLIPQLTLELRSRCKRYHRMLLNRNQRSVSQSSSTSSLAMFTPEHKEGRSTPHDQSSTGRRSTREQGSADGMTKLPSFLNDQEGLSSRFSTGTEHTLLANDQKVRSSSSSSRGTHATNFSLQAGSLQLLDEAERSVSPSPRHKATSANYPTKSVAATLVGKALHNTPGNKDMSAQPVAATPPSLLHQPSSHQPQSQAQRPTSRQPAPVLRYTERLSAIQARRAFSAYLKRMRDRISLESKTAVHDREDERSRREQLAIVVAFLQRAGKNLTSGGYFISIPPTSLPVNERQQLIASQLSEFIHEYDQETRFQHYDSTHQKQGLSTRPNKDFELFLQLAQEEELEHLLATYSSTTSNPAVFLG